MDKPSRLTAITRSFSYKLNVGNYDKSRQYESRDFFCSQHAECYEHQAEETSAKLYEFCKTQVLAAVRQFKKEIQ